MGNFLAGWIQGRPGVANRFDYSRRGPQVSLRRLQILWMGSMALAAAAMGWAQYPGQAGKTDAAPELRVIAVLEWTGDAEKPSNARMVPVAVLDQGELQDGGIYLARPEPMALDSGVEYELEENGRPVGLYIVSKAGEQQGAWIGMGMWKPLPSEHPRPQRTAKVDVDDDAQSDVPVLHRKHHADDAPAAGKGGSGSGGDAGPASSGPPADPDRPTLHRKDTSGDGAGASAPGDPDRPVLRKKKNSHAAADEGSVESMPGVTDPDRPRLMRGKPAGGTAEVLPSLIGLPAEMHQEVAVSDAKTHETHEWSYAWASPEDEAKMKAALEDVARSALGLNPPAPAQEPAAVPAKTTAHKTAAHRTKAAPPPPPPAAAEPAPLLDEQFRVFELAYGAGATMVLTAHSDGQGAEEKFVTLIAQPDLYGNPLVLLKSVTDAAHLDERPRMRLVDAVDAMADNRGELLFELRGSNQRQFALYRVLRGQADRLFVSGNAEFGEE
jgi:hypothetical protein